MGKSASGKDTIYRKLLEDTALSLRTCTLYTTRPMREGEREGVEYHFTDEEAYKRFSEEGKVIEERLYHTVQGPWRYFTVDDGSFDEAGAVLVIGTPESFLSMRNYFGSECVKPLYIECDDGIRLERALKRERERKIPQYREMCRRFLADCEDFSEERLKEAGIERRFRNDALSECLKELSAYIRKEENVYGVV
ncbi:MAG: guanylate kinase [Lachnospiraceae bacterium]|nr:guanylate kinase [Lachnospiraceae bacterium]